jgi:uncharacterized protein YmfQ (DUF2313 family)
MFDAIAYRDQLLQLLPPGKALPRDPGSDLAGLAHGLGEEMARIDARIDLLLDEAHPLTTLELLSDWERVAGLPDTCTGVPDTISERRVALANKIAQRGGQSIAFYTDITARLGYLVEIIEFTSLDAGFGAGEECNGDAWRFAWRVDVLLNEGPQDFAIAEFCAGDDVGDLLVGFGALNLECLISRAKPAHTEVIFAYLVDPEAEFWFDFTGGS